MAICGGINKKIVFCAFFLLTGITSNLNAQKEYHLGPWDGAIAIFQVLDTQYCSLLTQYNITDSVYFTRNIFPCQIDSVLIIHAEGGYVDTSWFNKVQYILIDDSIQLHADSSYMGSVQVEFDMEYVLLNSIIEKDELILNMRDGHPRPAGFLCDCEITDKRTISICEDYKKMIIDKLNHCKRYRNNRVQNSR